MRRSVWLLAALCAVGGLGCGNSSTSRDASAAVDALVARLNAAGLAVVRAGRVDQPFFAVREVLAAGTSQIEVFAYPLRVRPPPIVLYTGSAATVLSSLARVPGAPFAGA